MMYKSPETNENRKLEQTRLAIDNPTTEAEALLMVIDTSVHEMNQPMTVILGLSELLLAQFDPASAEAEDLTIIVREMRRMNEIVNGLKLLSHYQPTSRNGRIH
ncbi:MAG: hypothetical protein JXM69_02385 [Anaerolineae bacterium]|nr:hypothetical protein [Anaerolineae bacterium]